MVGARIKELRQEKRLSRAAFAEMLNVTERAVISYEQGARNIPIDLLPSIADILEVSTDYLLGRSIERDNNSEKSMREILDEDPETAQVSTVAAHYEGEVTEELKREIARQVKEGIEEYNRRHGRP